MTLDKLLRDQPAIWRGRRSLQTTQAATPTGFAALDQVLSGGGWPESAVCELLSPQFGIDSLSLLMPALGVLAKQGSVCLIDPPHIPFAPAWQMAGVKLSQILWVSTQSLKEQTWVLEQSLRSGACAAVLAWPVAIAHVKLRRLQLAAEQGRSTCFLFRGVHAVREASPATLRILLKQKKGGYQLRLLKRRGGWPVDVFVSSSPSALQ